MNSLLAFGLPSGTEWIFLAVLFLVFFGPEKIPQVARGLGKSLSEFKKAREELEREITQETPRPKAAANPPQPFAALTEKRLQVKDAEPAPVADSAKAAEPEKVALLAAPAPAASAEHDKASEFSGSSEVANSTASSSSSTT